MFALRHSHFMRCTLLLALVTWLLACHKWVPLEPPMFQTLEATDPDMVRVTRTDGRQVTLKEPRISQDSLIGFWDESSSSRTTSMPLEAVEWIEERRSDPLATVGVVLGVTVLVLGGLVLLQQATCDPGYFC